MSFKSKIAQFLEKYFFNPKWRCNCCGKEIFNDAYFCAECVENFPFLGKNICSHCGRQTPFPTDSCLNCENKLTEVDKARSVFRYDKPISKMIMKLKYGGEKYLADAFTEFLAVAYYDLNKEADFIAFVPMSRKAFRKRGYNQSQLLAEKLAQKVNLQVIDCLEKVKETKRQAKLNAEQRRQNLKGAMRVRDKKLVEGKCVLLVDDVTTTGATSETIAHVLKKAGAKSVLLVTITSVSIC